MSCAHFTIPDVYILGIIIALLEQIIKVSFVGNTPASLEGDLTKDGVVNVSDVTTLVNKVLE